MAGITLLVGLVGATEFMANETPGLRLGDLLSSAGLLKPADLREAMLIAKQQQLPVGRVLIMSGYLSEAQLQSAVQAQSMVKDGNLVFETAIKALKIVGTERVNLETALTRLGWTPTSVVITNKLGEFLAEAGLVAIADLQYALGQCQEIGLPLGRVLVVTGYLSEEMLTHTLNAQVLVRDGKISREQAITGLRAALERQISLDQSLAESGECQLHTTPGVRLGELFVGAGIIDEANLMNAVEVGLVSERLIGQVLRDFGLVSVELLTAALELQNMVAIGTLTVADATGALAKCSAERCSSTEALERFRHTAVTSVETIVPYVAPAIDLPLYQFLQLAGLINQSDIEKAVHAGCKDSYLMGTMLSMSGVMSQTMVESSTQALDLIINGELSMEQAIIVLKNCHATGTPLQNALQELGWGTDAGQIESFTPTLMPAPTPPPVPEPLPQSEALPIISDQFIDPVSDPGLEKAPPPNAATPPERTFSPLYKTVRAARANAVLQARAAAANDGSSLQQLAMQDKTESLPAIQQETSSQQFEPFSPLDSGVMAERQPGGDLAWASPSTAKTWPAAQTETKVEPARAPNNIAEQPDADQRISRSKLNDLMPKSKSKK